MGEAMVVPTQELRVPLDEIKTKEGHNPRRHFNEGALQRLAANIERRGVVQPILLRPCPDGGYWLVAGERRVRAARMAGLTDVPAVVRELSDAQALEAAIAENDNREDISAAEEAKAAQRALDLAEGNEEEAAQALDWSRSKLRSRLLLLHASESVLDALMTGEIKLGHAELLASLPSDMQGKVLGKVLAGGVTVEVLKAQMGTFTQELSSAIFDTRGCAGCPNNSTTQASLFEQHVGEGRCSNRSCWGEKTEARLLALKAEQASEFNVVWLDREKAADGYTRLVVDGVGGVGAAQANACKGCANFGALICTAPGGEGKIASGVCFDTECNREKAAAHAASSAPVEDATTSVNSGAKGAKSSVGKGAKAGKAGKAGKSSALGTKKGTKAAVAAVPKKAIAADCGLIRQVGSETLCGDSRLRLAATCFGMASIVRIPDMSAHGLPGTRLGLRHFAALPLEKLEALQDELFGLLLSLKGDKDHGMGDDHCKRERVIDAAALIDALDVPLAGRFKLDKAYLETLTKSGIEALLLEAGFVDSCAGEDAAAREKAFKKLVSGSRGDLITAVMDSQHNFDAFVPSSVQRCVQDALKGEAKLMGRARDAAGKKTEKES
ncbi:PRTRC system ParB family protein (plasmid) [Flagellatimonas centrodinii]|uniref:PRTRC system ParB family protein n=1 Tax=Flagellatimonas centrodinii TaxID=2806210 RepID=UPI001FFC2CCE|nr:PRTRC system ParB family protein [Flagellatimonas centrodinii]ULQ48400.1 PRTRC system ParB family protein [Flagellatimonas centrodinii]